MSFTEGYMSTKVAAEKWGIENERFIQDYLKIYGDEIGAKKAGSTKWSKWEIPCDAQRPILKEELLKFAQSLLRYKDNPTLTFSASSRPEVLFNAMCKRGYLKCADGNDPQSAWSYSFTDDGYDFVFNGKTRSSCTLCMPPSVDFNISVNFDLVGFLSFVGHVGQCLS